MNQTPGVTNVSDGFTDKKKVFLYNLILHS